MLLAGPNDRAHLESEIRKAHVICVVYAIDNPNSFDRIPTYWLPHFRQLGVNVSPSAYTAVLYRNLPCLGSRHLGWQQNRPARRGSDERGFRGGDNTHHDRVQSAFVCAISSVLRTQSCYRK